MKLYEVKLKTESRELGKLNNWKWSLEVIKLLLNNHDFRAIEEFLHSCQLPVGGLLDRLIATNDLGSAKALCSDSSTLAKIFDHLLYIDEQECALKKLQWLCSDRSIIEKIFAYRNNCDSTLLNHAASLGREAIFNYLVSLNFSVGSPCLNSKCENNFNALHFIALLYSDRLLLSETGKGMYLKMAKSLLDTGIDRKALSRCGSAAKISMCLSVNPNILNTNTEMFVFLLQNDAFEKGEDLLRSFVYNGGLLHKKSSFCPIDFIDVIKLISEKSESYVLNGFVISIKCRYGFNKSESDPLSEFVNSMTECYSGFENFDEEDHSLVLNNCKALCNFLLQSCYEGLMLEKEMRKISEAQEDQVSTFFDDLSLGEVEESPSMDHAL